MSFLTSRTYIMRSALPLAARTGSRRAFAVSSRQLSLSEESTNNQPANREKEVDEHKHDSLNKQKDGKGHWKKELASNSEAAIKADREEVDASQDTIKDLQKQAEELGKNNR